MIDRFMDRYRIFRYSTNADRLLSVRKRCAIARPAVLGSETTADGNSVRKANVISDVEKASYACFIVRFQITRVWFFF